MGTLRRQADLNGSVLVSVVAVLGALAGIISFLKIEIPFIPLTYLKFDFAEIPDVIAFVFFGPLPGLLTSTVHWLILNVRASFPIVGPLMKYLAVLSTLLGLWLGLWTHEKTGTKGGFLGAFALMFIFGALVRTAATTVANYALLTLVAPEFLGFAADLASGSLGLTLEGTAAALFWVLIITGLYNVMHLVVSLVPSYLVATPIARIIPEKYLANPWLFYGKES